jgi:hypothetical protein
VRIIVAVGASSRFDCSMMRFVACAVGAALVFSSFAGCASDRETREVRESGREPYRSVEDEQPTTPGDRRPGPIDDRAGAQWSW